MRRIAIVVVILAVMCVGCIDVGGGNLNMESLQETVQGATYDYLVENRDKLLAKGREKVIETYDKEAPKMYDELVAMLKPEDEEE